MWKPLMVATLLNFLLAGCTGETFIGFMDAAPDKGVVDASSDVPWDLGDVEAGSARDLTDATKADISPDGQGCVSGWKAMPSTPTNTPYPGGGSGAKSVFAAGAGGPALV